MALRSFFLRDKKMRVVLACLLICLSTSSCLYRMPEDGEVSVIPNTNNPHITGQSTDWAPGIGI